MFRIGRFRIVVSYRHVRIGGSMMNDDDVVINDDAIQFFVAEYVEFAVRCWRMYWRRIA